VLADFLKEDIVNWRSVGNEQIIIDFIAGMTDQYFVDSVTEIFLPQSTV
jgi:dGTP triphosphohydrolase